MPFWRIFMKTGKCMAVVLASGLLLSLGSCMTDVGYYLMSSMSDYLPLLLEALLENGTVA
jgi:proteasome assembly chaperone (PAC2) family protein